MGKQEKRNATIEARRESERKEPTAVVGIGASAGGLEAIESFFKAMPIDSGMAFVVVQHLSPDYKSLMVELLSRKTDMPVHRATARGGARNARKRNAIRAHPGCRARR